MNGRLFLTGTPFIYHLFNASISTCYDERILLRSLSPRQEIVCRDVREHRALFQDPRHLHDVGGGLQRPLRYPPVATVGRHRCLDAGHESVARGRAHRGLERVGDLLGLSGESPLVGAE